MSRSQRELEVRIISSLREFVKMGGKSHTSHFAGVDAE